MCHINRPRITMITRDFKTEFDNLIKEIIAPTFKMIGFKKKANNFYKSTNDLIQIFNVQKSQWNSKDDISFTFNIGFFSPEIFQETWDRLIPDIPKEYDCFISFRSGFITDKKDKWYELNEKNNYDKLTIEIKSDLQKSAIDLFNNYQTLTSLKGLINESPDLQVTMGTIPRFVFMMKTDLRKDALDLLFTEYKNAQIPKSSVSVINYPDGRSVETKSEPKINKGYIDSLIRIAKMYDIEIK